MLGAHLDSWHGGHRRDRQRRGRAVAMMEAVRILKALGVKPRRTIRIALWSGEEQGSLRIARPTSRSTSHRGLAARAGGLGTATRCLVPAARRRGRWTDQAASHAKLSAYFNLDNGTGRIRGIYAQENAAAVPIFEAWIQPLKDLGATPR